MALNSRRGSDPTCIVCCHVIDNTKRFLTIGSCGHVGCCSLCALRMRQLMDNRCCPICKSELARVICIRDENESFESFVFWGQDEDNIGPSHVFDEPSGIFFLQHNYKQIQQLRQPHCPKDKCSFASTQLAKLQTHLKESHKLEFCSICLKHKKVFLQEQQLFSKDALKKHCQKGDPKNGFPGHPPCDFCNLRFYSNLELYDHLHKSHFECDLCSKHLGIEHRYYRDYNDLENHFRKDHFLCEEPSCLAKKFVVFSSHLDFQAHMTKEHPHVKMSRKIDVHFTVKRATRDSNATNGRRQHQQDQEFESFEQFGATGSSGEENLINVADFPSLSTTHQPSGQLQFWEAQRLATPTINDFPELPSAGGRGGGANRGTTSAFRNALAPPPTPAMLAHMQNDNEWEYPELASAVAALGANNPMLRFVKPAKKQKKKNKNKPVQQQQPQASSATAHGLSVDTSQQQQEHVADGHDDDEEKPAAPSSVSFSPHSKTQLVLNIRQVLGSDEKYEQFRECCKDFRFGEMDVATFYPKVHGMFANQQDFDNLFVELMKMSPDQEQVSAFLKFHQQMQSGDGKASGNKKKKNKGKKTPAVTTTSNLLGETRPASAGATTTKRRQAPAASGWSSALRQSGLSTASTARAPAVVINNKKNDPNTSKWSSSSSWQAPSASNAKPPPQRASTPPPPPAVPMAPARPLTPELVAPPPAAAQPKDFSLKRTKDDFPDLPRASKPIGLQAVTRATWDEQLQAIVQNRSENKDGSAAKNKPRKQKKKTMTLSEMAMKFG